MKRHGILTKIYTRTKLSSCTTNQSILSNALNMSFLRVVICKSGNFWIKSWFLPQCVLLHLSSGLFDGIHQCGIFRDQCMRLCSFLGSDYRDCHVNLPHIIRWSCPRLRSSCGCHLFLYENGDKTRKNAENSGVRNQGGFFRFFF